MKEDLEELIQIALNRKEWHPDTKKVYIEMLRDEFAKEKPIYKYNWKTQIFEKVNSNIEYNI